MPKPNFSCKPTGRITYKELYDKIGEFSDEQLLMDVTVEDMYANECYAAELRITSDEHLSLDDYHPVLYFGDIND